MLPFGIFPFAKVFTAAKYRAKYRGDTQIEGVYSIMHIAASASRKIVVLFRAFLSSSLGSSEGSLGLNMVLGTSQ